MDHTACRIRENADCPGNHQYYNNYIQLIGHTQTVVLRINMTAVYKKELCQIIRASLLKDPMLHAPVVL